MTIPRTHPLPLILLAALLTVNASAQAPASSPKTGGEVPRPAERPALLEIRPDKPSARAGEAVSFVIEAVNRSDKALRIKTRQVFLNLRVDVRQPDGTCCVYNPYKGLRVNHVENFEMVEIAPGGRLEIARLNTVTGEAFESRAWQTYKVRGRPVDWFERFPLGPDGRIVPESQLPKPFTLKGVHNLHASYAFPSKDPGVVALAESPIVDFTVTP